eukprot:gene1394-12014_t
MWAEKERAVERKDQKDIVEKDEIFTEVENMATKVEHFSKLVFRLLNSSSDQSTKIKNKNFSECFTKKKQISKELEFLHEQVHNKNNPKLKLQLKKISTQFTALDGKLQAQKDQEIKSGHIKVKQNSKVFEEQEEDDEQIEWEDERQIQKPKSQLTKTQEATLNVERLIALETNHSVQELEQEMKELQGLFKDLNDMVDTQQISLDEIENNVDESSLENLEVAVQNIKIANKGTGPTGMFTSVFGGFWS